MWWVAECFCNSTDIENTFVILVCVQLLQSFTSGQPPAAEECCMEEVCVVLHPTVQLKIMNINQL